MLNTKEEGQHTYTNKPAHQPTCGGERRESFLCSYFPFQSALLLSSSTRKRFYPQPPSERAVVTGVFPSPRYMPSIISRIQYEGSVHSHFSSFYARRFPTKFAHSCSRAFRSSNFAREQTPSGTSMHLGRLQTTTVALAGTIFSYYCSTTPPSGTPTAYIPIILTF